MDDIREFPQVLFKTWLCRVVPAMYNNKILALRLIDIEDGSPIAMATVNLEEHAHVLLSEMSKGNAILTFVKDYSENEGMLKALVDAQVVVDTGIKAPSGYVEVPVVELAHDKLEKAYLNMLDDALNKDMVQKLANIN